MTLRTFFFTLALPGTMLAQWPSYPAQGVPMGPDGKPNLNAPAPKTADGHPDFTGLWEPYRERPVAPPKPVNDTSAGLGPVTPNTSQFFNIGVGLKEPIPFTPWAAALRKERAAANNKDNPDAHCLPIGLTQLHMHPQPRKIVQTPGLMVMIYESNGGLRQVFMDGRPLPKDPQPWWYGYSVGRWDGDTLVIETSGFRDDVWLDVEGSPLTESGKTVERIRRPSFGIMEIEMTIEDPKAYSKPWKVNFKHRIMLNTELIEFICNENEQDAPHLVAK